MSQLRQEQKEWIAQLRTLKIPEDARLVELVLLEEVTTGREITTERTFALARSHQIPAECVSKVLTFVRRKQSESRIK